MTDSISAAASAIRDASSQSTQNLLDLQTSYAQHADQIQETLSTHYIQLASIQSSVCRKILTCTDGLSNELRRFSTAVTEMERLVPVLVENELQSRIRQEILEDKDQVSEILAVIQEIRPFLEPLRLSLRPPTGARPSTRNLVAALSRSLATDIAWTYQAVITKFLCLFKMLLCLWPQLVLLSRLLRSIPRSITLVLEDNIEFEDALGGFHSLQFQYFKHWDIFERMLQHQFQSKPGDAKVAEGEYRLFRCNNRIFDLNAANWNHCIRPGMKILMSLKVSNLGKEPGLCPLCNAATNDKEAARSRCENCDIEFLQLSRKQVARASQETTTEEGLWLRLSEWRIFKRIDVWFETRAAERAGQEPSTQPTPDDTTLVRNDFITTRLLLASNSLRIVSRRFNFYQMIPNHKIMHWLGIS